MNRRLPPFPAIRAFEAAARHMSFVKAADELCVTPSAISHQIKSLEEFLGHNVFAREGNRLELTGIGRSYLNQLTEILDALDRASAAATSRGKRGPLRVIVSPSFGARWLMPRIDSCPLRDNLRVTHSVGAPDTNFSRNNADVVLQWQFEQVPGVVVEPLMQSGRYPAASPEVASRICAPEDLLAEPLLRDDTYDNWDEWFDMAGLSHDGNLVTGGVHSSCELIMTAAENGQGIALVFDAMARGTLKDGRLVRLFDIETAPIILYSVAYRKDRADDPLIRTFRDWLFSEVEAEGTGIAPHTLLAAQ